MYEIEKNCQSLESAGFAWQGRLDRRYVGSLIVIWTSVWYVAHQTVRVRAPSLFSSGLGFPYLEMHVSVFFGFYLELDMEKGL